MFTGARAKSKTVVYRQESARLIQRHFICVKEPE